MLKMIILMMMVIKRRYSAPFMLYHLIEDRAQRQLYSYPGHLYFTHLLHPLMEKLSIAITKRCGLENNNLKDTEPFLKL